MSTHTCLYSNVIFLCYFCPEEGRGGTAQLITIVIKTTNKNKLTVQTTPLHIYMKTKGLEIRTQTSQDTETIIMLYLAVLAIASLAAGKIKSI